MALSTNLIAYYPLDEASGNAVDAHSNHYDLTETSGTIASAAGKVGNARDFELGDTEWFEIADNADFSTGNIDFTVAAWVNLESLTGGAQCIASKGDGSGLEWDLRAENADRFRFYVSSGSGFAHLTSADVLVGAVSTATWYFLVAWHDATSDVIGLCANDGTPTTTAYSFGCWDSTAPFRIGANGFGEQFDGLIDEVGFWKRVLSASEITELYNAGAGRDYAYISGGAGGTVDRVTAAMMCILGGW